MLVHGLQHSEKFPAHGALYSVHFVVFRFVRWVWEALRSLPIGSGSTEYSSQFPLRHKGTEKFMNYFPRLANWTVGENKKLNFYVCCYRMLIGVDLARAPCASAWP